MGGPDLLPRVARFREAQQALPSGASRDLCLLSLPRGISGDREPQRAEAGPGTAGEAGLRALLQAGAPALRQTLPPASHAPQRGQGTLPRTLRHRPWARSYESPRHGQRGQQRLPVLKEPARLVTQPMASLVGTSTFVPLPSGEQPDAGEGFPSSPTQRAARLNVHVRSIRSPDREAQVPALASCVHGHNGELPSAKLLRNLLMLR